jgi:hypothetical protein
VREDRAQSLPADVPRASHLADQAVAARLERHGRKLGVRGKARQRTGHGQSGVCAAARLEVGSQINRRAAPVRKRPLEQCIVFLGRPRAEIDVEEKSCGRGALQQLQQARVMAARPRPFVQRRQAFGVDPDDDDVAGSLAEEDRSARLRDDVLDARQAAIRMQEISARKDGQHGRRPYELR